MPYSQHPVNKQTPTYSSDTTDAELIVLTPDVVSAHFFFKSCVAFMSFYVWHKLFLSTFLHKSDISPCPRSSVCVCVLGVQAWALWGAESSLKRDSSSPRLREPMVAPRKPDLNTQTSSDKFLDWKVLLDVRNLHKRAERGVQSLKTRASPEPWRHTHTQYLSRCTIRNWPKSKHKEERKKNSNHGFWWSTRSVKQNTVNYLLKHGQILPFFSSILHFYSIQMEVTEEIMVVKTKPTSYYYRL